MFMGRGGDQREIKVSQEQLSGIKIRARVGEQLPAMRKKVMKDRSNVLKLSGKRSVKSDTPRIESAQRPHSKPALPAPLPTYELVSSRKLSSLCSSLGCALSRFQERGAKGRAIAGETGADQFRLRNQAGTWG
jgi:hypothetical protein